MLRFMGLLVGLAAMACLARVAAAAAPPFALPATFSGVTPCADCPGIRTTLKLGADHKYVLDQHYLERPVPDLIYKGPWDFNAASSRIVLRSPYGAPQYLKLLDPKTLRFLDRSGSEMKTSGNENLQLVPPAANSH